MTATLTDITVFENRTSPVQEGSGVTHRELELGAIIDAYNHVTEKLKSSHEALTREAQRLREQLEEKNRELERRNRLAALGEMAAGVAHEVRNPLGGILLSATMLENDLRDVPDSRKHAQRISHAARMLDGVVGDILAFASHGEPRFEAVDVGELTHEAVDLLKPGTSDRSIMVQNTETRAVIDADSVQLRRALLNVIANAIAAGGEEGRVWIRVDRPAVEEAVLRISVSDNGPGVPTALRDRIFNPFFTTKDSGTGLGLAIVHGIVEAHGGRIEVDDRDGGGAVFRLLLPGRRNDATVKAGLC